MEKYLDALKKLFKNVSLHIEEVLFNLNNAVIKTCTTRHNELNMPKEKRQNHKNI